MAPPRPHSPRKRPTQARARTTVEAILRAAAHILRTSGWDACNTNAVARRAGVSIGSLYQYFPSKEALLAALAEQHAEQGLRVLRAAGTAAPQGTFEERVRHDLRAMVALQEIDPKLHRVLREQLPRLQGGLEVVRRGSRQSATLVRAWLEAQRPHLRPVDLEVATFLLVTAVESVAHLQALDRPLQLDQEALVEELSLLVLGYLGVRGKRRS